MIYLRQSTAAQAVCLGPYLDPADFDTPLLALTINASDIQVWKAGASVTVSKNFGGATHMTGDTFGFYVATFDDTDTDTCGSGKIVTHPAGANAVEQEFCVLPQNVYDSFVVGTDQITVDDIAAEVVVEMDADSTKLASIQNGVAAMPTTLGQHIIDGAVTQDQVLALMLSIFGGTASGLTGTEKVFRDQSGAVLMTATFTNSGASRSVTLSF